MHHLRRSSSVSSRRSAQPRGRAAVPAGDAVMTMGHVLLNVSDVAAHREFWTQPVRCKAREGRKARRDRDSRGDSSFQACSRGPDQARGRPSITWD